MKASVGDRIVISSNRLDSPLRDGTVVECRHGDGTPPYLVEWSDSGQTGLFFPGPDAQVEHVVGGVPAQQGEAPSPLHGSPRPPRSKTWRVEVGLFEADGDTTAHAVLVGEVSRFDARGTTRRNPHDPDVPEIGDEVAVARALRRLSDRLLAAAAENIAAVEAHLVEF